MSRLTEYQIVGRYMSGKEVSGYHLQSLERDKSGRYTREQVCYLVGKGQITNCEGQIYKDKVILRGVGMSLEDLPVVQENSGEITRTDSVGKIRKGTSNEDAMTQLMLVESIVAGKINIGYVVENSGGARKTLKRADILKLASEGRIGNARVQQYQGKTLLRGVNINLNELPVRTMV